VYKREYYSFRLPAKRLRRLKITYTGAALFLCALWITLALVPAEGRETPWVGMCWYLSLIPMLYFLISVGWLLSAGEKMTYRTYYASGLRMKVPLWFLTFMMGESATAQLVLVCRSFQPGELAWLLGAVVCVALAVGMLYLQKKYPAYVVRE
ncbi:MAG: hypothetical protein LUH42_05490, partial [Oscillospiraceae bacterium]|nr:hypothetical protein [Oscillospiraceae bacterium]